MSRINVVMCSGFSPSSRMVRKALRRVAEKADIKVISICPPDAGLTKYLEEITSLDPARTMVVEGCDGCCGSMGLMMQGFTASKTVVMEKVSSVDDKAVDKAEQTIMAALKEMGQ
ncbi:hypothetical protein AOA80_05480 [Methanomassiliicoccales archaeon RumEn M1]|jgi:hypothetical protein|nr:hypothetical protein AOA80_05480 [Methanomassiliicoccales archaeon RumEn M1]